MDYLEMQYSYFKTLSWETDNNCPFNMRTSFALMQFTLSSLCVFSHGAQSLLASLEFLFPVIPTAFLILCDLSSSGIL